MTVRQTKALRRRARALARAQEREAAGTPDDVRRQLLFICDRLDAVLDEVSRMVMALQAPRSEPRRPPHLRLVQRGDS